MSLGRRNVFSLAAAATFALAGTAVSQETIRVASFTAESALGVQELIIPWMEAVEAEVGDKVDLRGFWGGSLGRDPFSQYDLVRRGVADIAWVGAGYSPGRFPQIHALELPFMAENGVQASLFGWEMVEQGLIDGLDEFKVITVWTPSGDRLHMREPVDSIDDIEGQRIRTASSQQASLIEFLGGVPQTIGPVEVNDALARGAVDGLAQAYTGMNTFGTFDVVSGTYEVPLGNSPFLLLMNKEAWEALPSDVQAAMDKHGGRELARIGGAAYDRVNAEIREAQLEKGYPIVTPTPEDLADFRERFQPLHQDWIEKTPNGQAVYDAYVTFLEEFDESS